MGTPRGDSAVTKRAILAAARELFARRGVHDVSVRQVAVAAGVDHALVHRYFGTKDEMVAAIVLGEARALAAMARPDADPLASRAALVDSLGYLVAEGRTSLLLMLRAELDGLAPERLVEEAPLRPLRLLADWLGRTTGSAPGEAQDPRVIAMVLGAAVVGLVSMQPLLMSGVGLQDEDPEDVLQRCLRTAVALAAGPAREPASSAELRADGGVAGVQAASGAASDASA